MIDMTMSELCDFVVDAVEEAEARPDEFRVAMDRYHSSENGICVACAAGLSSLKLWSDMTVPEAFHDGWGLYDFVRMSKILGASAAELEDFEIAIDSLRLGFVSAAADTLYPEIGDDAYLLNRSPMPDYHEDPAAWKKEMRMIASDLRDMDY